MVPTAGDVVHFTVTGGTILALDNADMRDFDPYRSDRRRAFNGRGLVILRAAQPGTLTLTASGDGLRAARVSVRAVPGDPIPVMPAAR